MQHSSFLTHVKMRNPYSPHFLYNIHNYTYSILIGLDLFFYLCKGLLSAKTGCGKHALIQDLQGTHALINRPYIQWVVKNWMSMIMQSFI